MHFSVQTHFLGLRLGGSALLDLHRLICVTTGIKPGAVDLPLLALDCPENGNLLCRREQQLSPSVQ